MPRNNRWMHQTRLHDSKFEKELCEGVLKDLEYHPKKIDYQVHHTYTPDFKYRNIYIEVKGRFMDSTEARKYKFIRDYLKTNEELVFLFQHPTKPMPHAKARQDGTKQTHAEWADKNGFRWFDKDSISEIWR